MREYYLLQLGLRLKAFADCLLPIHPFHTATARTRLFAANLLFRTGDRQIHFNFTFALALNIGAGSIVAVHLAAISMKGAMVLFDNLLDVEQVALLSLPAVDLRQSVVGVPAYGIQKRLCCGWRGVFVDDD